MADLSGKSKEYLEGYAEALERVGKSTRKGKGVIHEISEAKRELQETRTGTEETKKTTKK